MGKWNKMTKTKAVLLHLQEYGSITSWEAIKYFGVTRLSVIIYNLKYKYNLNIKTEIESFTDRFGTPANFAKYILVKDDTNDKN